ncbi:Bug family tripartite tricarboxylate transporter substrate binding protein [Ramlibacter sp.]|uniref:Bug family tripartite tricarboxylate transporter substrate binding protein n=1 Tax=Ramlibacter sp. TaxID=1917967 RepID=UPI003D0F0F72
MNRISSPARRAALLALLSFVATGHAQVQAQAQDWPARTVKIVVPYPAGGGTDALARLVAERLNKEFGQAVIVENRAGGGGNLGTELVARAPADGYTLLMGDNSMSIYQHLYPKLNYDPIKDFVAIAPVAVAPILLVSASTQPYRNLGELLQGMKANPAKFDYAFGGLGTPQHLTGQLFNKRANVSFNGVPYKGSGPALQDVLSGQVGYGFFAVGSVLSHIRAGKLRGYGVALPQRSAVAPEVPTFAEQGLQDVDSAVRYFLAAPAATPKPVVAKVAAAMAKVRQDASFVATLEKQGVEVGRGSGDDVTKMLLREGPVWGELIRSANIKPE